jgi:uracil-DNA glycosylase family 4
VKGIGPEHANLMLVGEAPGAREEATGKPFVGRSGKFLDSVLQGLGVDREEVFITNVVRCRPPGNRKPSKEEAESCLQELIEEVKKVKPKVVVALGATAINSLTGISGKLSDVIGKERQVDFAGLRLTVVPCYHPSAAMRNRRLKAAFEKAMSRALAASR